MSNKPITGVDPAAPGEDRTSLTWIETVSEPEWMRVTDVRPLPCPFCGSTPVVDLDEKPDHRANVWCHIHCKSCSTVGDSRFYGYSTTGYRDYNVFGPGEWVTTRTLANAKRCAVDEAMNRWNRRHEPKVNINAGEAEVKIKVELSQANGEVHKLTVDSSALEGTSTVSYKGILYNFQRMTGAPAETAVCFVEVGVPRELDSLVLKDG